MHRWIRVLAVALALSSVAAAADKLNLNTASKEQLVAVGFSEAQALQIIRHRQENGPLLQVEELMAVEQMKRDTFDKVRDRVTVDE